MIDEDTVKEGDIVFTGGEHGGRFVFVKFGPATNICNHKSPVTVQRIHISGRLVALTECFDSHEVYREMTDEELEAKILL